MPSSLNTIMTTDFANKTEAEYSQDLQKMSNDLMTERELNEVLIRSLSHDLANPLSAIQLSVQNIKTKNLSEEALQNSLSLIERSTKASITMITNIRRAVLTKSKEHLTTLEDVSLIKCLETATAFFAPQLTSKSLQLEVENELKSDVLVKANTEALIDHIFYNVLSNAIKFSRPNSKISIKIQDHENQIRISFKDHGIGLQKSNRKTKTPLCQAGTEGEQGSGFGLIILGYFIRQFGGHYSIHSEKDGPNPGTTVTLLLNKA